MGIKKQQISIVAKCCKSKEKEQTMGDWEDLCEQHGVPNNGDLDWLIDSNNSSNSMYHNSDEFDKDNLDGEQETTAREYSPKNMVFENLQEAKEYAMKNPGYSFTKNPDGPGFIIKSINNA